MISWAERPNLGAEQPLPSKQRFVDSGKKFGALVDFVFHII